MRNASGYTISTKFNQKRLFVAFTDPNNKLKKLSFSFAKTSAGFMFEILRKQLRERESNFRSNAKVNKISIWQRLPKDLCWLYKWLKKHWVLTPNNGVAVFDSGRGGTHRFVLRDDLHGGLRWTCRRRARGAGRRRRRATFGLHLVAVHPANKHTKANDSISYIRTDWSGSERFAHLHVNWCLNVRWWARSGFYCLLAACSCLWTL